MQFRLENHKNEILEKSKNFPDYSDELKNLRSKENFFSKILTNINIGIGFNKPPM